MQNNMQDEIESETDIGIEKDLKRQDRMARSEAARLRRQDIKLVREQLVQNEWAAARRAKKKK
jgi:hypothetical protein|tara:strand:- start:2628 stop:2816 length:189 start_codon:yes stop_codon:yes gene_type:complete